MSPSTRFDELPPSDYSLTSGPGTDVEHTEKVLPSHRQDSAQESNSILMNSPWQEEVVTDQWTMSLYPTRSVEDTNISVQYDPLSLKQYDNDKGYDYDQYDQGFSMKNDLIDLVDERKTNGDLQLTKSNDSGNQHSKVDNPYDELDRRAVSLLRMGRAGEDAKSVDMVRVGELNEYKRRAVSMLRMGRSGKDGKSVDMVRGGQPNEDKRRAVSMLRMGRSGEDKRAPISMLRMGRAGEDKWAMSMLRTGRSGTDKKALSMLRLGRSEYPSDDEKRTVRLLRMGKDIKESKRPASILRMGRGFENTRDKSTRTDDNLRKGIESQEDLGALKRAVRMLRLGRSHQKKRNDNQAVNMVGIGHHLDSAAEENKSIKMLKLGTNVLSANSDNTKEKKKVGMLRTGRPVNILRLGK